MRPCFRASICRRPPPLIAGSCSWSGLFNSVSLLPSPYISPRRFLSTLAPTAHILLAIMVGNLRDRFGFKPLLPSLPGESGNPIAIPDDDGDDGSPRKRAKGKTTMTNTESE